MCVFLLTGSLAAAQSNTKSTLNQTGDNHTVTIDQKGLNQTSTTTQKGDHNILDLSQSSDNTAPQNAEVLQDGSTNTATINQSQTGSGNLTPANNAFIEQVGDNNRVTQKENAPSMNQGQSESATQHGNQNMAVQNILNGWGESLILEQAGDNNHSSQSASGIGNNRGMVTQEGNSNNATQTIVGLNNPYSGYIKTKQVGDHNTATQSFNGGTWSHSNNGSIESNGTYNVASQTMSSGYDIDAKISQQGNSNEAYQNGVGNANVNAISQKGKSNITKSMQTGDGNVADFSQQGNSNLIRGITNNWATQIGGSQASAMQMGKMNTLKLNQMNGAVSTSSQQGHFNTAVVNQQ